MINFDMSNYDGCSLDDIIDALIEIRDNNGPKVLEIEYDYGYERQFQSLNFKNEWW